MLAFEPACGGKTRGSPCSVVDGRSVTHAAQLERCPKNSVPAGSSSDRVHALLLLLLRNFQDRFAPALPPALVMVGTGSSPGWSRRSSSQLEPRSRCSTHCPPDLLSARARARARSAGLRSACCRPAAGPGWCAGPTASVPCRYRRRRSVPDLQACGQSLSAVHPVSAPTGRLPARRPERPGPGARTVPPRLPWCRPRSRSVPPGLWPPSRAPRPCSPTACPTAGHPCAGRSGSAQAGRHGGYGRR